MQAMAMPNRTAITVRLIALSKEKNRLGERAGCVRMPLGSGVRGRQDMACILSRDAR